MSLSGWLHYPAARFRARRGLAPERPWIVPASIGWLRRRIRSDWLVLELGAGRSTPWLARRAARVVSLEDNEFWHGWTRQRLAEAGLGSADLRFLPVEAFPAAISPLPEASFDLVVVDFLETPEVSRVDCIRTAREKVRPGGYLLLDDSDRPGYAEVFELLSGWRFRSFSGVKDGWPEVCETGVFRRPRAGSGASGK